MKEKYLHYLWRYKLLPFHQLTLANGDEFNVVYQGDYNSYESGPDFLNAKIQINGILWAGNVELHVKSLDWYAHGHQNDKAYDNVILHVVFEHNGDVMINNSVIQTLELKTVIQNNHYSKFEMLLKNKKTVLCGSLIKKISSIDMVFMQESALLNRLTRKTSNLDDRVGLNEPKEVLYFLLGRSMGAKINQLPFEELTHRLPLSVLKNTKGANQKEMILMTSGLPKKETIESLLIQKNIVLKHWRLLNNTVSRESWKFGGTRSSNSPIIRVEQFARIVEKFDFETEFVYLPSHDLLNYILKVLTLIDDSSSEEIKNRNLTIAFKYHLIINCFVPFMYWFGQKYENENLIEKSLELLRLLPKEKNGIIDKWNEYGVFANNAAESQALLEIFNEFCSKKKCLSCKIGIRLLVE